MWIISKTLKVTVCVVNKYIRVGDRDCNRLNRMKPWGRVKEGDKHIGVFVGS